MFESYTALRRTAKIRIHLAPLTSRFATDRLTALTQSTGAGLKTVPEVLFVCVHNAGRSQIANGLLDHVLRQLFTIGPWLPRGLTPS